MLYDPSENPIPSYIDSHYRGTSLVDTSFFGLCDEEVSTHFSILSYDRFRLTKAVSPSYDIQVKPVEGFVYRSYGIRGPGDVLVAAVSAEKILNVFDDLLVECLGRARSSNENNVRVFLERWNGSQEEKFATSPTDLAVLRSRLFDVETLLLECGFTSFSFTDTRQKCEVTLCDHKLLYVFDTDFDPAISVLKKWGICHTPNLRVINDAEHTHHSNEKLKVSFYEFVRTINAETL